MIWVILIAVFIALAVWHYSRRQRAVQYREYQSQLARSQARANELATRPADIAVELMAKHLPTLVEKAAPYIKHDDYGILTIGPEFDGEIRYFFERVILADPAYIRASRGAMSVDPDARERLFESSAVVELVRNAIVKRRQDEDLLSNWGARKPS
jgi:hypothetical protein